MTEEQFFEIQFEKFAKIADDNNLTTTFSMYEITDINENSELLADIMTDGYHNNITLNLPNRKLTWLELWKYADMLYQTIGDSEHMFIENFEVKEINGKRELQVFFGS
jgi:hypothetical protein